MAIIRYYNVFSRIIKRKLFGAFNATNLSTKHSVLSFVPVLPGWASCVERAWQRQGSCCSDVQLCRWPALWSQTPRRSVQQTVPASSQPGRGGRRIARLEMPAHSIWCLDLQENRDKKNSYVFIFIKCRFLSLTMTFIYYQLKHNCNLVLPPFYLGRWFQQLAACWAHLQRPAQRSGWQRGHWSGGWRASRGVSRSEPPPSGFPCVHCLGSDRHSGAQTGWGSDLVKEPKS